MYDEHQNHSVISSTPIIAGCLSGFTNEARWIRWSWASPEGFLPIPTDSIGLHERNPRRLVTNLC